MTADAERMTERSERGLCPRNSGPGAPGADGPATRWGGLGEERRSLPPRLVAVDVGSTTVKAVMVEDGKVGWQDYQRHNTRQAEKVVEFLGRMESEAGLTPGRDRVFFTGSGAGFIAPLVGGKLIQEVVAVAACVERLHPDVRFVSEIGGEDMKTIFFTATGTGKSKQVYMQSACSGGTGTFIEKTARKLQVPGERLAEMPYAGMSLHKVSSKCGIFAETDANTLVKTGVPVEEIIASLFEAVVYQNLATLTKGNTPMPEVLLLGGPNLFFRGLQEAWRHHLAKLWAQRKIALPEGREPASLINVPRRGALLRVPRLRGDRPEREARDRHLPRARQAHVVGRAGPARAEGQGWRPGAHRRRGRPRHVRQRVRPTGALLRRAAVGGHLRARRLRLRQHHRQGRRAVGGPRAALLLLRAVQGQPHRGRPVALPPGARRGVRRRGRARAHGLRQGPPQGRAGGRRRGGGDRGPRHRRAALLP